MSKTNSKTCACGCNTPVGSKSNFAPGHDARLVSQVMKGEKPESELAPYPKLVAKFQRRVEAKTGTPAPKPAKAAATDEAGPKLRKCAVKVGRWTNQGVISEVKANPGEEVMYLVTHKNAKGVAKTEWVAKSKIAFIEPR